MAKQPLGNIFDFLNDPQASFMGDQQRAYSSVRSVDEWAEASRGECPDARKCSSAAELARWFTLAGIAAGAIARSGNARS